MDEENKKYKPDDGTRMEVEEEDLSFEQLQALVQKLNLAEETLYANLQAAMKQNQIEETERLWSELKRISKALKAANERLAAAQIKMLSLLKARGPPYYDALVQRIIRQVQAYLPHPSTVVLQTIQIGGFTSPLYPNSTKPFLLFKDPVDVGSEVSDAEQRITLLLKDPRMRQKVVFATSGSGKTWTAVQMLKRHFGYFFVAKNIDKDKNPYGSMDLYTMATEMDKCFMGPPYKEYIFSRRFLVEFASQCLAWSRFLVLYAWTTKYGNAVTSEPWLLLQLFPKEMFQDKNDWFVKIWYQLFQSVVVAGRIPEGRDLDESIKKLPTMTAKPKVCVIDEAQLLMERDQDKFESTQQQQQQQSGDRVLLGSILSPVLHGLEQATELNPIIMGTGTCILNPHQLVASGGIATAPSKKHDPDFRVMNFPSLSPSTVLDILKKELGDPVHEGDDKAMELASRWLWGRHGWVSEFIFDVLEPQFQSPPRQRRAIAEVLKVYIQKKTISTDESATPANIIAQLRRKYAELVESAGKTVDIFSEALSYNDFAKVAWINVYRFDKWQMGWTVNHVKYPEDFIEAGLGQGQLSANGGTTLCPFEPLVLEAYRQCLLKHVQDYLLTNTTDSEGLEKAKPLFRPFMADSTQPVMAYQCAHGLNTSISPPHNGVWRAIGPRFGREGISFRDAEGFYRWFAERVNHLQAGTSDIDQIPYVAYPDYKCGPDAVQFVEQYALQEGQWVQTGVHGVVFYKDEYRRQVNVKGAKLSIDPALAHHVKRGRKDTARFEPEGTAIYPDASTERIAKATELKNMLKPPYDEFLKSLNDFVVFRILVLSRAKFFPAVKPKFVGHTRPGNTRYTYDCVMVVHGESQLVEVFGEEFGKIVGEMTL